MTVPTQPVGAPDLMAPVDTPPKPKFGATLRFEQRSLNPWDVRLWLNGQEITNSLMRFELHWGAKNGATQAILTVGVDSIEVDAETLVHLKAIHDEQKHVR